MPSYDQPQYKKRPYTLCIFMLSTDVHISIVFWGETLRTVTALVAAWIMQCFNMIHHCVPPRGCLSTDEALVLNQTIWSFNLLNTLIQAGQVAWKEQVIGRGWLTAFFGVFHHRMCAPFFKVFHSNNCIRASCKLISPSKNNSKNRRGKPAVCFYRFVVIAIFDLKDSLAACWQISFLPLFPSPASWAS